MGKPEPAILKDYFSGSTHKDFLFQMIDSDVQVDGCIISNLSVSDFNRLDHFFGVEDSINRRTSEDTIVMREGQLKIVQAFIYVSGKRWNTVKGGLLI